MLNADLRAWLCSDLARRCRANPKYSMRAYARMLEFDPSALAKLMAGKRVIGPRTAEKIFKKIGLPEHLHAEKSPETSLQNPYSPINLEHFKMIAHWYHYAILELMHTDGFLPSEKFVARKLALSIHEVRDAVARLKLLGLLQIDERGRWKDISGGKTTTLDPALASYSTAALRQMQKEILLQAIDAMEKTDIAKRDQTSITMAIDCNKIPEVKERILKFRRELGAFLAAGPRKNAVYQLSMSLFPVSN